MPAPFDPRRIPLTLWCDRLFDETFPPSTRRTLSALQGLADRLAAARGRRGALLRLHSPARLLARLRPIESEKELATFLARQATARQLLSLHWYALHLTLEVGRAPVDGPLYQDVRSLLGRRPTRLSMLRASLLLASR